MDSSFSLNSPNGDVSPSNGVKLQFGARDYDEIFAGSSTSSIPEINLSDMRERVGLSGARGTENVEYASIFSGFDDDDVAIPYQEFGGTGENKIAKQKTTASISIGVQSLRESSSQRPPKNARSSNKGSSDQPTHEYRNKQRISVSLNQISPRDYGESNGKTHIEQQAHDVPGVTYFVSGNTHPENTQGENRATSLRREVSRSWSFSAEVESVKAEEGKSSPSHPIDQSYNVDEGRSRISDFHSKDASERISADQSFPFFDEELGGDSSAAALKKAIEQAQECIRLAKSIKERKREDLQDEPKTDSPINVLYEKKASDDHGDDHHAENNASFDPVIPMFSKVDGKFAPVPCSSEELFYAKNAEVEKVRQAVRKHEDEFNVGDKKYATLCRQDETLYATMNVKEQNASESVDLSAVQTRTATEFVANETGKTANSESSEVEPDGLMYFIRKSVSHLKEMATAMSPVLHIVTNSESKGTEVVTDLPENHEGKNFNECSSKLKFAVTTNMPNESGISAEKDVLDLEKTIKMSEVMTGLKENCNAYVKSCDDEDNKVLYEEDEEWFESEVQLKEEEINEKEPEIYLEVEIDALRPNCYSEGDVQMPPEDPNLNDTTESRMGTSEREAAYDKINLTADFQKFDPKNDKFQLSGEVSETQDSDQFHKYCEKTNNGEAIDDSFCEARSDETNIFSCEIQELGCDGLYHKAEKSHGATESFPITNEKEAGKKVDLEPNENAEIGSFSESASEQNLIGNSLHCIFTRNVGFADEKPEEMSEHVEEFNTNNEVCCPDNSVAANTYRENLSDDLPSSTEAAEFDLTNERHDLEQTSEGVEGSVSNSNLDNIDGFSAHESREHTENEMGNCSTKDEVNGDLNTTSGDKEHVEEKSRKLSSDDVSEVEYSHLKIERKETEKSAETQPELETGQNTEKNKVNPITKENNAGGYEQRYDADDVKQRIEAIKRGRERQKEQIAVERAIREARERAFVDAQQRAVAEAQRKVEREGRAAVERATAEARERALQKAMSMKNSKDARTKDDAHPMERFSSSSRNNGLKHSFSSSDLDKFDGTCSESAQRCKARLEREQRIRERVEKALAEKNKRDLHVQKEQAERNRLSASLDAEIKRWSSGKEGNLRALLSTLQYILGPKSRWQPISLTEMITAAAVKKAYRKATLYVHPDKLQQRGATVRQKYVCEKVFDLLKAAWNRFNSEER